MHLVLHVYSACVHLLLDLDSGSGAGAVSDHTDREASFAIRGSRHGHQSHCVGEQVWWRVSQTPLLQHWCQDHLLVAFTTGRRKNKRKRNSEKLMSLSEDFQTRPDKIKTCYIKVIWNSLMCANLPVLLLKTTNEDKQQTNWEYSQKASEKVHLKTFFKMNQRIMIDILSNGLLVWSRCNINKFIHTSLNWLLKTFLI